MKMYLSGSIGDVLARRNLRLLGSGHIRPD